MIPGGRPRSEPTAEQPTYRRQQVPRSVIVYDCIMSALIALIAVGYGLTWVNPSTLDGLPTNLVLSLMAVVPVAAGLTTGLWHRARRRRPPAG